jgi:hypothetical protein
MSNFFDDFNWKNWEKFCEIMLRQNYGQKNFWPVPDEDGGDLGLEFYTIDGTLFQCYYPEQGIEMSKYKKQIQKKINDDLKKLKDNEKEIAKMLDTIVIHQWILLTPENKSKDFNTYCNKKKKEVIEKNISYIDPDKFSVKIETADSYSDAKLYALGVHDKSINIILSDITNNDKNTWKSDNSKFSENIERKSNKLMGNNSDKFQSKIVAQYIKIEKFLDKLKIDYPDIHGLIENSARAQLEEMEENSLFESVDKEFIKNILNENKEAFFKYSKDMSDTNVQLLPFGYLSKWLAECYMDFDT